MSIITYTTRRVWDKLLGTVGSGAECRIQDNTTFQSSR
jgi:hypothetical protein